MPAGDTRPLSPLSTALSRKAMRGARIEAKARGMRAKVRRTSRPAPFMPRLSRRAPTSRARDRISFARLAAESGVNPDFACAPRSAAPAQAFRTEIYMPAGDTRPRSPPFIAHSRDHRAFPPGNAQGGSFALHVLPGAFTAAHPEEGRSAAWDSRIPPHARPDKSRAPRAARAGRCPPDLRGESWSRRFRGRAIPPHAAREGAAVTEGII